MFDFQIFLAEAEALDPNAETLAAAGVAVVAAAAVAVFAPRGKEVSVVAAVSPSAAGRRG